MDSHVDVLHTLKDAERTLGDPSEPFRFIEWNHCTCGHIYRAVIGRYSDNHSDVHYPPTGTPYADVIVETARALGWQPEGETMAEEHPGRAANFVSNHTVAVVDNRDAAPQRGHALKVVRDAIAKIEAEQEHDRLALLETETREPVLA